MIAACLLALHGCELAPDVGGPLQDRCLNEDSDPDSEVSFVADIGPILTRACRPCHEPGGANAIGFEIGGLDLTSHDGLVAGGASSGASIITAGQPCDSVLVQKLSAGPPFGSRMPFNGPPFLASEDLRQVRDWIAEGALDN